MQRMVYAPTEEQYMEAYEELKALELEKVQEYFDRNWHQIETRIQWAGYFTNSYHNYFTRTTNRLESINQKLKTVITKYGTLHNFSKETIQCIQSMSTERDQRTIRSIHRKPTDVTNETQDENLYRNVLTYFAFTKLLAEKMKMADVAYVGECEEKSVYKSHANARQVCSVELAAKTCTCAFFKMMALPCRHLLRCLLDNEKNLFDASMCHRRWFKRYLPADLIGDIGYIENETAMTQNAKFREANELLTCIADSLSEKSTAIFRTYMIEMRNLLERIQNDQIFAIQDIGRYLKSMQSLTNIKMYLFLSNYLTYIPMINCLDNDADVIAVAAPNEVPVAVIANIVNRNIGRQNDQRSNDKINISTIFESAQLFHDSILKRIR